MELRTLIRNESVRLILWMLSVSKFAPTSQRRDVSVLDSIAMVTGVHEGVDHYAESSSNRVRFRCGLNVWRVEPIPIDNIPYCLDILPD